MQFFKIQQLTKVIISCSQASCKRTMMDIIAAAAIHNDAPQSTMMRRN